MITIDTYDFAPQGGIYTINLTKTDTTAWGVVSIADGSWYNVIAITEVSNRLYMIDIDVSANTTQEKRWLIINASSGVDSAMEFIVYQNYEGAGVSGEIVGVTPSQIPSAGGILTIDVYSTGEEVLTAATIITGSGYVSQSRRSAVTIGGSICTRFVFSVSENTGTSVRQIAIEFSVSDGTATGVVQYSTTQEARQVKRGSMVVMNISATAAGGAFTLPIECKDMNISTIVVESASAFVQGAAVQVNTSGIVLVFSVDENTSTSQRSGNIALAGVDNYGNAITAQCSISQAGVSGDEYSIGYNFRQQQPDGQLVPFDGNYNSSMTNVRTRLEIAFRKRGALSGDWAADPVFEVPQELNDKFYVNFLGVESLGRAATFVIHYNGGNIEIEQVFYIKVSRLGNDGLTYTTSIPIILRVGGAFPIWQDIYTDIVSNDDYEDYEILSGGEVIYSGRAFKRPNEDTIKVNVSRIVAPYLTGYYKDVQVFSDGILLAEYTFVRDYSYDDSKRYYNNLILNAPINGSIPSGLNVSASLWSVRGGEVFSVVDEGGSLVANIGTQKGLNMAEWISTEVGKRYFFGGAEYEVVDMCNGVVLKYVNAYGAVDYFIIEGVSKKRDSISRSTYEKDADALSSQFQRKDYQAEMVAVWSGVTGWLTDAQSLRLKHLIESVEVYMIDSAGNEIPIVMRDNTLEYKTWRTNGKQLINYTLSWEESQTKIRR